MYTALLDSKRALGRRAPWHHTESPQLLSIVTRLNTTTHSIAKNTAEENTHTHTHTHTHHNRKTPVSPTR